MFTYLCIFQASIKGAAFGRPHKGGGRPSAARPLCGIPYGWVCGGWEGIRRGKIMPNRAGIVAAKWYFAKWYLALQVQGTS